MYGSFFCVYLQRFVELTMMSLKRFQDPDRQRSFLWLFYAGFVLILLGESILLPTERTPVFLSQIGNILHWLGAGLLLLRNATLLPAYPRYTLTSICLLVAFRASFFLADPISPKLYVMALVMAASHGSDMKVNLRCSWRTWSFSCSHSRPPTCWGGPAIWSSISARCRALPSASRARTAWPPSSRWPYPWGFI